VRTDADAPKHRGISWLICPMNLPGIEIRPLPTLAGEGEFSEVFFSDVRVPIANRVGAENDGWRVTNVTLRFERGTAFASEMIKLQRVLADLVVVAKQVTRHDACAWDDAGLRREVGHLLAELDALWAMVKRSVSESSAWRAAPGPLGHQAGGVPGLEGSAIKLFYTELFQRVSELGVRILGRAGLSRDDVAGLPSSTILQRHLNSLSLTIAAGSSQIQRNIVGERILGLPKDR
jgi:alkylation response protein AidB-like acyl-CoA dehydrogenase